MEEWEIQYEKETAEVNYTEAADSKVSVLGKNKKDALSSGISSKREGVFDELAEKRALEKKIVEGEKNIIGDLLEGCDLLETPSKAAKRLDVSADILTKKQPLADWSSLHLKSFRDCSTAAEQIAQIIRQSNASGNAWVQFLSIIATECSKRMEEKDIKALETKIASLRQGSVVSKRQQAQSKKKVNDDVKSKITNFHDEYNMMYGDRDKNDEDEETDLDDDFM